MLELICAIPESIGWAIVGALSVITIQTAVVITKTLYREYRKRISDDQ